MPPCDSPRGLAFDAEGRLLVLSGTQLIRCHASLTERQALIAPGLDDPQEVMVGPDGAIYIADHGQSHQVKVFTAEGQFVRAIGKPGAPACGPYDETKMHHPIGMTLTPSGELWVAEEDYHPKRVSIWHPDGSFKQAFYGPTEYGRWRQARPARQDSLLLLRHGVSSWTGNAARTRSSTSFFRRDQPR